MLHRTGEGGITLHQELANLTEVLCHICPFALIKQLKIVPKELHGPRLALETISRFLLGVTPKELQLELLPLADIPFISLKTSSKLN